MFQLLEAVDGCRGSMFHMGQNDKHAIYDDLELICRSGEKVESFRRMVAGAAPRADPNSHMTPAQRRAAEGL